ncbi:MAG: 50S ribosomal protein L13e [Candidatus Bathyarchaeota archaeon BA1]|nr:MAG: 50S ribosomal protein L13e [Candidatus Bathyarchaeota archaeon BA1]
MKIQSVARKKNGRTREGRGFSRDELMEAGLDFRQALKLGIPIDLRRKTKHKENIKALKKYLKNLG